MKKVSIILLVLVMLIAVVSCDKDKSGEMITTYEEFVKAYNNSLNVVTFFTPEGETSISYASYIADIVKVLDGSRITVKSFFVKDGSNTTVKTSEDGNTKTYSFNNIAIDYKYVSNDGTTDEKDGTFTLTGTYSLTKGTDGVETYSFDVTMNSTSFKFSYSVDTNKKYTAASIGDKSVELRLLNAEW